MALGGTEFKAVAITGVSSGIGEARALARHIAVADGEAAYACTDAKRRSDLSDLVKSSLDVLRVKHWEEMIDINTKGVLRCLQPIPSLHTHRHVTLRCTSASMGIGEVGLVTMMGRQPLVHLLLGAAR
jgi:NADP-dependent 3-hydroxy acid dehydrogenase YdfG